ncbi:MULTISPECIES: helix-turn-helix domain-containing protein [unclassified Myroides]|uniref:helix-turn-helix domain-containing protein n=1 Tax=unclassified Myroides TaxID=2642485 RepID=UPI003D2F8D8B
MEQIQILGVNPQQLQQEILEGLKSEIKALKNSLTPQVQREGYITRKEAARLLEVDLGTLWNWKNKGYLMPCYIGRRVYYKQSDIDKAMIQQK